MTYRILIIEDDKSNSELLRMQLERSMIARFEVHEEGSFRAGLGILAHNGIDLVILDKKLPDDEELAVAIQKIRAINEKVAIYVLSGDVELREAIRVIKAGGNECRQKPPEPPERLAWSVVLIIEQQKQIVSDRWIAKKEADAQWVIREAELSEKIEALSSPVSVARRLLSRKEKAAIVVAATVAAIGTVLALFNDWVRSLFGR